MAPVAWVAPVASVAAPTKAPDGKMFTGRDAASAIGIDCMFGAETSDPPLEGCTTEALAVLNCFPNCPDEVPNVGRVSRRY